jgi:hypothetical protein
MTVRARPCGLIWIDKSYYFAAIREMVAAAVLTS